MTQFNSCGHSCVVAKPRGMATNGGCYCFNGSDPSERSLAHALARDRLQVRKTLEQIYKLANAWSRGAAICFGCHEAECIGPSECPVAEAQELLEIE